MFLGNVSPCGLVGKAYDSLMKLFMCGLALEAAWWVEDGKQQLLQVSEAS